jgi:uncharacterized RDD family membrane protein YckC
METETLDDVNYNKIRNVEYANFGHRLGASILDTLMLMVIMGPLMYFGYDGKNVIFLILAVIIGMLYKPIMEGVWGATLGKMILGITMVDSDFDIIDLGQSFLKNGIYIISSVMSLLTMFWIGNSDVFLEAEGALEAFMANQGNPYEIVSGVWSLLILVSCLSMLGSGTKQTLHDKLAKTFCVKNSSFEKDQII